MDDRELFYEIVSKDADTAIARDLETGETRTFQGYAFVSTWAFLEAGGISYDAITIDRLPVGSRFLARPARLPQCSRQRLLLTVPEESRLKMNRMPKWLFCLAVLAAFFMGGGLAEFVAYVSRYY